MIAGRKADIRDRKTSRRRRFQDAASGDSLDWKGISAGEITKRVTGKVQSGSIVLFHNAGEHTPEALPDILDYLLAEGIRSYRFRRSCSPVTIPSTTKAGSARQCSERPIPHLLDRV
ncbi:MAG: hypothetical protein ACLRSD_06415 [Oscillibacter sp.]